jgi:hypothetical protein
MLALEKLPCPLEKILVGPIILHVKHYVIGKENTSGAEYKEF